MKGRKLRPELGPGESETVQNEGAAYPVADATGEGSKTPTFIPLSRGPRLALRPPPASLPLPPWGKSRSVRESGGNKRSPELPALPARRRRGPQGSASPPGGAGGRAGRAACGAVGAGWDFFEGGQVTWSPEKGKSTLAPTRGQNSCSARCCTPSSWNSE